MTFFFNVITCDAWQNNSYLMDFHQIMKFRLNKLIINTNLVFLSQNWTMQKRNQQWKNWRKNKGTCTLYKLKRIVQHKSKKRKTTKDKQNHKKFMKFKMEAAIDWLIDGAYCHIQHSVKLWKPVVIVKDEEVPRENQ